MNNHIYIYIFLVGYSLSAIGYSQLHIHVVWKGYVSLQGKNSRQRRRGLNLTNRLAPLIPHLVEKQAVYCWKHHTQIHGYINTQ